jgi:UPF0716 protein FxsA
VNAGRAPAREVLDGGLVIFGGALLLTPGFVTDVFGLVLLLPPTRALVRRVLVRRLVPRMVFTTNADIDSTATVDSTATDVPPGRLP